MPIRTLNPETNIIPEDDIPIEISLDKVEEYALRAFFYDYCITTTNQLLSRGFLSGLESLLRQLGPNSDLSRACRIVSFASHGNKLRRPHLLRKAQELSNDLLSSLARRIELPGSSNDTESLLVTMLLGLYEVFWSLLWLIFNGTNARQIIIAAETNPGHHVCHARGITAILQTEDSVFDIFGAVHSLRCSHPIIINSRILVYASDCKNSSKC